MNRSLWKAVAFLAIPSMLWLRASAASDFNDNMALLGYQAGKPANHSEWAARSSQRQDSVMRQLGLSPEQQSKLKTLREQGRSQTRPKREQLRAKRRALIQYLKSPQAKESQALGMQAEISDLQRQMNEQRIRSWFRMREILTPEQLQKLEQIKPQKPGGFSGKPNPQR